MKRRHSVKSKLSIPGYHCRGRIWVEKDGKTFLGFGRVALLEKIRQHGSISKAAQSMKMSYKHAWDLVDSMNHQAAAPLVITCRGGKGGGGAHLTEAAEKAISDFKNLHKRLSLFMEHESKKL